MYSSLATWQINCKTRPSTENVSGLTVGIQITFVILMVAEDGDAGDDIWITRFHKTHLKHIDSEMISITNISDSPSRC